MYHLGNKHSKLTLFVKSAMPTSSTSTFMSRFTRKSEHFVQSWHGEKKVFRIPGTVKYV